MPRRQVRQLTVAERIKQARGDRTQEQVAHDFGVGLRTWQRWEAGEVFPSTAQVFRLADHFGLDPRDLINDRSAA